MTSFKVSASSDNMRGTFELPDGSIVRHATCDSIPWAPRPNTTDPYLFTAKVVGGQPAQFGGTSTADGGNGGPGNYRLCSGTMYSVKELPPGAKFTLEMASWGDMYSAARMKVTVHESDESLQSLEKALRLAQIEAMYPSTLGEAL